MKLRTDFHQARWQEPLIFTMSQEGEQGVVAPLLEPELEGDIDSSLLREDKPNLPELGQMQVLRHYLRLSQETLGADFNVDVGQGTCTMKYSPKINEKIATNEKVSEIHPLQDESTVQGSLEMIYKTDQYLQAISGLDAFSFQPRSGTQGILTMASIVRAYHQHMGNEEKDEIITTMFSHPSDAAAPATLGFKVVTVMSDESTGLPDKDALIAAMSERTAAIFITNPEDTGIFNPDIVEITEAAHAVGALCAYDQANANGILGITRAKEANFDICFFNLHKTFSIPHCCGGPAVGGTGVIEKLKPYLPSPLIVKKDNETYGYDHDMPLSVGKIGSFYGVVPAIIRAYAWIRSVGAKGLREVAEVAVLNNNYMLEKIKKIRGASAPYAEGRHRIEQVRYSWQKLYEDTGVTTENITSRMADFGFHMWSSHHPFVVPQPMSLEPTEAYSKVELDEYIAALEHIANEAYESPEIVKTAPHRSVIHKLDYSKIDDPDYYAMSWRSHLKKQARRIENRTDS